MTTDERRYGEPQEIESRYLVDDKQKYYLASNQESIQQLITSQQEELTRVLIEHKSEYDRWTREARIKKNQTEELSKKIEMLQWMDEKQKKKVEEAEHSNEVMKKAIEIKKRKKEEELFIQKTLMKQIEKAQTEILLIKKETNEEEVNSRKLEKECQKLKHEENEVKLHKNVVFNRITDQNRKNQYEGNEQDLQMQYYRTIIDQKHSFIKAADDRKEKQIKIAFQAKNDSQDKQEVEKRQDLELELLYNNYLRRKMGEWLNANEEMEDTFCGIRDICGSNSLDDIITFVLTKEKRYNSFWSIAEEYENKKNTLKTDIEKLESESRRMKNDVIIDEDAETETSKQVATIPVTFIEEEESKLLEEESALRHELNEIQQKHTNVELIYKKVEENIALLLTYREESPVYLTGLQEKTGIDEEKQKNTEDNLMLNTNIDTDIKDTQQEGWEDQQYKQEQEQEQPQEQLQEQQQEQQPEGEGEGEMNKDAIDNKGDTNENKENKPIQEQPTEENNQNKEDEQEHKNDGNEENPQDIGKEENIIINPINVKLMTQYKDFLDTAEKTIDMLFLCHSRADFLNLMREKGIENQKDKQNVNRTSMKAVTRTKKPANTTFRNVKTEGNEYNYEYKKDDFDSEDLKLRKLIFSCFVNESYQDTPIKTDKEKKLPAFKVKK